MSIRTYLQRRQNIFAILNKDSKDVQQVDNFNAQYFIRDKPFSADDYHLEE